MTARPIEAGSQWFHRETLTAVEVHPQSSGDWVIIDGLDGTGLTGGLMVEDFCGDYIRNEPVTPELLVRLGWHCKLAANPPFASIDIQEDSAITIWFRVDRTIDYVGVYGPGEGRFAIPTPSTLLDLLVMLRVFGIRKPEGR